MLQKWQYQYGLLVSEPWFFAGDPTSIHTCLQTHSRCISHLSQRMSRLCSILCWCDQSKSSRTSPSSNSKVSGDRKLKLSKHENNKQFSWILKITVPVCTATHLTSRMQKGTQISILSCMLSCSILGIYRNKNSTR